MRRSIKKIYFVTLITFIVVSCNNDQNNIQVSSQTEIKQKVYDKEIGDSAIFRMAIVKSIEIPFQQHFDTMILKSKWTFRESPPDDYLYNYPETNIDKSPFIDTLAELLGVRIITDSTFEKYMNQVLQNRFNGEYPESLFYTCLADNLYANIVIKRLKDNSFLLIEDYTTIDSSIKVQKIFRSIDDNWSYQKIE